MIIYKTTNLQTGKIYIGKDTKNNPLYFGSGIKIKDAIKNYGLDKFKKDVIDTGSSIEELNEKEKYWIKYYNATNPDIGYNITEGGDGGDIFTNHPNKEEYREKLRAASNANKDILRNDLSRISKNLWKNDNYRTNVKNGVAAYWKNEENIKKFSNKMKEVLGNPDNRKKWSDCKKGDKNVRWLGYAYLYDLEGNLVKKYDKITTAKQELKINFSDMNKIRSGIMEIILTSSKIKKSYYEGFKICISKV